MAESGASGAQDTVSERVDRDGIVAGIVARHGAGVPELARRLADAGHSADRPPDWNALARVRPLRKTDLAALQHAAPPLGGLVNGDRTMPALFWSPGDIVEPVDPAAVRRLAEQLTAAGFVATDRVLNGFSYHFTPAGLLFHDALRRLGATVLPIGPLQPAVAADFAVRAGATAFVGIASHLRLLLDGARAAHVTADGRRLALRLALAGAEPFGDPIRREIESRWGVRCRDLYGTAESGVVAVECDRQEGLHLHAGVLAETLDPESGERLPEDEVGELALTVDGDDFPLLRFVTGDLVRVSHATCACGNPAQRLFPLGRVGGSARVRGMLLHAAQLRAFCALAGPIDGASLAVRRAGGEDRLVLMYRLPAGATGPGDDALRTAFRDACRLRVDELSADPSLQAGRFELIDERFGPRPAAAP